MLPRFFYAHFDLEGGLFVNNNQHQEAVQRAVQKKFRGKATINGKTLPLYPNSAEREFKRITNAYMKILNQTLKEHLPEIMEEYKRERRGDSRFDDIRDLERWVRDVILKIAGKMEQKLSKFRLQDTVEKVGSMIQGTTRREWKRAIKETLGVNIFEDYYKGSFYDDATNRWVADSVNRIKSLPTDTLGSMQQIILDGFRQGKTIRDVTKDIQGAYDVTRSKAKFLARDQVATLNAQITKLQQQDAGVYRYKWSTSNDERVRPCHKALDGQIISWDDPPEMWYTTKSRGLVRTGRRCHPGEDYCCRCCAIPVFDYDTVNIPMSTDND